MLPGRTDSLEAPQAAESDGLARTAETTSVLRKKQQALALCFQSKKYANVLEEVNRPGFPRRLGASGSDAAQTLQAAGRQHWNDDVWGYRTFRCS